MGRTEEGIPKLRELRGGVLGMFGEASGAEVEEVEGERGTVLPEMGEMMMMNVVESGGGGDDVASERRITQDEGLEADDGARAVVGNAKLRRRGSGGAASEDGKRSGRGQRGGRIALEQNSTPRDEKKTRSVDASTDGSGLENVADGEMEGPDVGSNLGGEIGLSAGGGEAGLEGSVGVGESPEGEVSSFGGVHGGVRIGEEVDAFEETW